MTVEWEFNEPSEDITKVVITYTATHNNATPSEGVIDVDYPDTSVAIFGLQPLTTYKVSAVVHGELSDTFGSSIVVNQEVDTLPLGEYAIYCYHC